MRMYTSYNGMRSTGGAVAPSGNTLRKCVLAGTPSLKTLMQLLIGIVVAVAPAGALFGEPGVNPDGPHPFEGSRRPPAPVVSVAADLVLPGPALPSDQPPLGLVARAGLPRL